MSKGCSFLLCFVGETNTTVVPQNMSYVPKYNISWFTWRETYHSNMQKTARKIKKQEKETE